MREASGSSTQQLYVSTGDFLDRARAAYHQAIEDQQQQSGEPKSTGSDPGDADHASVDADNRADSMDRFFLQLGGVSQVHRTNWQEQLRALEQIRQQTLSYLLQLLFGDRYARGNYQVYEADASGQQPASYESSADSAQQGYGQSEAAGVGGTYYAYSSYSEYESTAFAGSGTVVTSDGREINFGISVAMSRSFSQTFENQVDFGEAQLKDPLVINLDVNAAEISDQKFFFDIDADGEQDEISMLGPHSGYLALDHNGDGVINDGSELFGTESGNGFADLAAFDEDGNGWIDEADAVFDRLKIWVMDADGSSRLYSLAEKEIGAIYLGSEATPFSLNNAMTNETNAVIRRTGMFLYEDGAVGTVQQVDLAT